MDSIGTQFSRALRVPLALSVLAALVASVAVGCGDDSGGDEQLPANAVARVGDTVLTQRQLRLFASPDRSAPETEQQVARRLILFEWLQREAKAEGLSRAAGTIRASDTPKLSASDASTPMVARQAKFTQLLLALMHRRYGPVPSDEQVARYYRAHPDQYARPDARFMHIVATDSRDQALAAKGALEDGEEWGAVIERHGTDRQGLIQGSGTVGAAPGEMPVELDKAIFAAPLRTITGPVRTDEGWYVFKITSVVPLPRKTLAQTRGAIRARLQFERQERARRSLIDRLVSRYRPLTECARDVQLPHCRDTPLGADDKASLLDL